jgi:hypothetical protein
MQISTEQYNKYGLTPEEEEGRKELQIFVDQAIYLSQEGWTKKELKAFLDEYVIDQVEQADSVTHIDDHRQLELPLGAV